MNFLTRLILPLFLVLLVFSCGGGDDIAVEGNGDGTDIDSISADLLIDSLPPPINGKMFSIPSPVEMTRLIRAKVPAYNEAMLTNPESVSNFTTTFKRAVNMGIFGADLGYATIYENNTKAVSYLSSIEKLSDELGIAGAFDQALLERFIENGNNPDSMLVIMAEGYRAGDEFLKDNAKHDVATLILTGGWIESLYFAAVSYESSKNQEIADRIGQQRTSLKTIIDLLTEYNTDEFYTALISDLEALQVDFAKITFDYTYIEPIDNEQTHQTNIKSKTAVKIDSAVLSSIISKVKSIRNGLIG
jgi:hypothetical protein